MKPWQKIAIAFVALAVGVLIFTYSRAASAAGVSILSNKINVPPSKGPAIQARRGQGAF